MAELGDVYRAGRQRITEVVRGLPPETLDKTVPACPEWTVKDTLAHLSGVCADIVNGNIEGVATDPWTAAQVAARKDWPLDQLLEEWDQMASQVEPIVQFFPGRVGSQFILDMSTHEADIRHAVGAPGARDTENVDIAVRMMVETGFAASVAKRGLPPLEVVAGDHRWVLGAADAAPAADTEEGIKAAINREAGRVLNGGEPNLDPDLTPAATIKIEPFELMRALTGRRSRDQIRAYDWSGDPEPYVPAFQFAFFTTRPDDLDE